ncbi:MAG: aspartyl/glutamyl-tRNA(Asn/Gln) amidotransferase subunit [Acidobacteria bacterium]|nr:aspartyl/glutamyl-tRNA(Asn/Gln) amidotransferase subunit [Acidobacteriota bacterium]
MTDRAVRGAGRGTIREVRGAIGSREQSAAEICRETLDHIASINPQLNAFNTVIADRAMARAEAIDREPERWRDAPLAGVPIAVKDNLCTRGIRTTASSRMLEHYVPAYDATVVARLEQAGAIMVGKTNCDEFAMGSSNENSAFGPVRNPWALDRIPGGTSGGSAAAVAARLTPMALGSDTGGSIRQPAALCGVVGLKPTYGRVSRYGLIAHASSLDQIGPLTRTAYDAAVTLGVLAGADAADATSAADAVPDYTAALTGEVRGVRIGVPRALLEGIDAEVSAAIDAALAVLEARGAAIVDVDLPHARFATPVYYLVSTAEASSNLARYDGVRYGFRAKADTLRDMYARTRAEGFGPEVKRRIMLGTYVLSAGYYDAYYLKAQQVRTLILRDYDEAFAKVDVVAMPTSPTPAVKIGERVADPVQMYLMDIFTVSANLSGLPAISVPCGFTAAPGAPTLANQPPGDGRLPIGLQLMGRRFDEAALLRVADAYERDTEWSKQPPPLTIPNR